MRVCDHLNLLERDYYGLAIWETPSMKVGLGRPVLSLSLSLSQPALVLCPLKLWELHKHTMPTLLM